MNESPHKIEFQFQSTRENIPGILRNCLEHIRQQTQFEPIDEEVLSKIKWVITEMLTNAVKHSGVDQCMLTIHLDTGKLVLEKEDQGEPLTLVETPGGNKVIWPLAQLNGNVNFQIYHNGEESLRVRTNNAKTAFFFTEQLEGNHAPELFFDTSEHFGLLIMVKASEEFTYEYDPESRTNRFRTTFNLKNPLT
ncbi:ATP-binding protein [Dyadobacter sandarakinus]|uniref:Anti-sigma regulatory factor n=1 Tax=Dyadobacter sandarakinus TaxID=2747268 RepID=A0ABX7I1C3_9BACT|nr:anti-sigma regulatory factor [Dyadobacter sandarakinus]QRQ99578.1 anti-sigma regulatory factor [Dyadobacter sandarakinus]